MKEMSSFIHVIPPIHIFYSLFIFVVPATDRLNNLINASVLMLTE